MLHLLCIATATATTTDFFCRLCSAVSLPTVNVRSRSKEAAAAIGMFTYYVEDSAVICYASSTCCAVATGLTCHYFPRHLRQPKHRLQHLPPRATGVAGSRLRACSCPLLAWRVRGWNNPEFHHQMVHVQARESPKTLRRHWDPCNVQIASQSLRSPLRRV